MVRRTEGEGDRVGTLLARASRGTLTLVAARLDLSRHRRERFYSLSAALDQLDRHILRRGEEGDAHTGPNRPWLHGERHALSFQLRDGGIDVVHRQAKVLQPH